VSLVEEISWQGKLLAFVIKNEMHPDKTTFPTPSDKNLQVGFIVYPKGGEVIRHIHKPLERHLVGTAEVLLVKKGKCEMTLYNDQKALVASRELNQGDLVMLVGGGHGFKMLEDTILVEIKQGPYTGIDEKERF
jgi:oxalate decarboxylase/phosphoglucose isomerase-like protein (cupin superfamily)